MGNENNEKQPLVGFDTRVVISLRRFSKVLSIGVIALGLVVLVGWQFDIVTLKRIHPSLESMKVNTASLFVILGLGLFLSRADSARRIRWGLASIVVVVSSLTLMEYLFGVSFGLDEILYRDVDTSFAPGRMAPATVASFLLFGVALIALESGKRRIGELSVMVAAFVSYIALCGYLYGATSLYSIGPYVSIALHTTVGFLLSSLAFLTARPTEGATAVFASDTVAGMLLRRTLPFVVFVPLFFGWLRLQGQQAGLYDTPFGVALLVVVSTGFLGVLISLLGASLHRSELIRRQADQSLIESEQQFRLALEAAPTGMLVIDETGQITLVNRQIETLFGYARHEVLGKPVEMLFPERFRGRHSEHPFLFVQDPTLLLMSAGGELCGLRKDGTEIPVELALNPLPTPEGNFILVSVADITLRQQSELERAELLLQRVAAERRSERSRFFEVSIDIVCITDSSGRFIQVNPAFTNTLGYSFDELNAVVFFELIHSEDIAATLHQIENRSGILATYEFTNRYRCKDGSYRRLQWRSTTDADGTFYATARDVTVHLGLVESLQSQQISLASSLKEREVLLQEVHHRVKNNLQVIASLLNMQLRQITNAPSRSALEECQSRVLAIALIHEKLYQSTDYSNIPFSDYARSLVGDIFDTTGVSREMVSLDLNIEDCTLAVDKAIPCGLILNELITNALKYAFPNQRRGLIHVELRRFSDGEVLLSVADDGIGIPEEFDIERSSTLGMQLVSMLVEQLDGRMEIAHREGTKISVIFPMELPK